MVNICKNKNWPTLDKKKHWCHSDMYFTYDLRNKEIGDYLNIWFNGANFKNGDIVLRDEMITLKKVDGETASHLYHKKYNPVSIFILPFTTKKTTEEPMYNMKAMIHSIDDSSFGIWWSNYYGTENTFNNLTNIRMKLMEWISTKAVLNGTEFLNQCIILGASEESKDYN
jgi:hypothetical protein